MPATSKKQYRFMEMMAHNPEKAKSSSDISPQQASEYVSHNKGKMAYKNLPEHHETRFKKLKKAMKT